MAQLEHLVFCHCNLQLLEKASFTPEPSQVNIDKIDIMKVRDIPDIPPEERDIYSLLYEELSAPIHETRAATTSSTRGRGRGRAGQQVEAESSSSSGSGRESSDEDRDDSSDAE